MSTRIVKYESRAVKSNPVVCEMGWGGPESLIQGRLKSHVFVYSGMISLDLHRAVK